MLPPVTERVPLHSKSPCLKMARAFGGANNLQALNWGFTNEKDPNKIIHVKFGSFLS